MEPLKSRFKGIWKTHKKALLILLGGLIVFQLSVIAMRSLDPTMPGWMGALRYLSYFSMFIGVLMITGKKKWYISSNILVLFMLVLLVEFVCFGLLGFPETQVKTLTAQTHPEGSRWNYLGFGSVPDTTYTEHTLEGNGDTMFSATYTIDKHGYRVTPEIDSLEDKYNLFFGCSIMLGYGVNDDQTLASHYQTESKARSYNFAWNGYGVNHTLAILQNENLKKSVPEKDGTAYYIFFWDHILRSVGSMEYYNGWLHTSPYYYLDGEKLVRDKSFVDGRYWQSKFYETFHHSAIKSYFDIQLPTSVKDPHFELVSEMLLEAKKEYKKQFGNDDFVLVIYPSYKAYKPSEMRSFLSYLKKKKIRYIDLSNVIKYSAKYTLNGDGHPNSETHRLIAKELLKRK